MIDPSKAFWANNTVDNTEIEQHYSFQLPPKSQPILLFIGRLVPSKRIATVLQYYNLLKNKVQNLQLEIIADGPDSTIVKRAIDADIKWHGTLVDEARIAPIMQKASVVFVPGLSGLSINHAFAYGRPYITLQADEHGPEIVYLHEGQNGFILPDEENTIVTNIAELLNNRKKPEQFCYNARDKGKELSIQNWVTQIKYSLLHE